MFVGTSIDRPALRGLQLGRHLLGLSNMKVTLSPLSSALRVMMSSFPAHLSILDMFPKFMPVRSSFVRVGQSESSSRRCFSRQLILIRFAIVLRTHGDVPVASVVFESFRPQQQADECHVRGVHRLQRESCGAAVEVGIGDQILHRFEHLLQQASLHQPRFEHVARFFCCSDLLPSASGLPVACTSDPRAHVRVELGAPPPSAWREALPAKSLPPPHPRRAKQTDRGRTCADEDLVG